MLGMDGLPQGIAFFSTVDVDKCLKKEVEERPQPIGRVRGAGKKEEGSEKCL